MLLFTVCKNELKLWGKDLGAIVSTLLLCLLFIGLFTQVFAAYHFSGRYSDSIELALVNKDNSAVSKMLVSQLENTPEFRELLKIHHVSEEEAVSLLRQDKIAGAIILPEGLVTSIYWGENKPLALVGNAGQRLKTELLKQEVQSAANLISAGQSGVITVWQLAKEGGASQALLDRLYNETVYKFTMASLGRGRVFAEETVSAIPNVTPAEYFTASLLVVFIAFMSVRGMKALTVEKETGIFRRLRGTAAGTWQVLAGKFLAFFLQALAQIILILFAAQLVFDIYLGDSIRQLLGVIAATAFVVTSWSLLVAAISPTSQAADLLGYLGTLLLLFIGGNIYPLVALPGYIRTLSAWTFSNWTMNGFLKVFSGTPGLTATYEISILMIMGGVLLVTSAAILSLAGRE